LASAGGTPRCRLRAVGEHVHRRRKLTRHDVGQRHALQHGTLVGAQRDPHPLQRLGGTGIDHVLRPLTAHAEQLPVDGADDVRERDLRGRPGQPEAALGAALAAYDVAAPQVGQDRLEELAGDVLRLSELLGRDMPLARRGELDGGAQRVVGACRQSHVRHYAASRSGYSHQAFWVYAANVRTRTAARIAASHRREGAIAPRE
jgi:hypothetical protein